MCCLCDFYKGGIVVIDVILRKCYLFVLKYGVCLCTGCDGRYVSCFNGEAGAVGARVWEVFVFVMQMFYVCVHPVAPINTTFCMTFRLLILVEDARGDHMEG